VIVAGPLSPAYPARRMATHQAEKSILHSR
jgi:hypothetical protein